MEHTPKSTCYDFNFRVAYTLTEPAEVALEDYARTISRADEAHIRSTQASPLQIQGVHLCGLRSALTPEASIDIEAFACHLTEQDAGGLGWS